MELLISTVFGIVGIPVNIISLFFFLSKDSKVIADILLVCLSFTDMATLTVSILRYAIPKHIVGTIAFLSLGAFILTSSIIKVVLAVSRTVVVAKPFVRFKPSAVYTILGVLVIIINSFYLWMLLEENERVVFGMIVNAAFITFVVVDAFCAATTTFYLLLKSKPKKVGNTDAVNKREFRATVTILMISFLYISIHTASFSLNIHIASNDILDDESTLNKYLFAQNCLYCVNSVLNPVIYITRIKDLKHCIISKSRLFTSIFLHSADES